MAKTEFSATWLSLSAGRSWRAFPLGVMTHDACLYQPPGVVCIEQSAIDLQNDSKPSTISGHVEDSGHTLERSDFEEDWSLL